MASSKFKKCCGLLTMGCVIAAVVLSCLAIVSCDFITRDILDPRDGSIATSATFGLFKSSLTGNTCVSSSDRDVDWLYDWARISALLAPLFGAILIAAILVDRSCNCSVRCMKAMQVFLFIGAQLNQLFTALLWLSDVCWLKTGDGWGDYEFKGCTVGNGFIYSATAYCLFFVGSLFFCCAPKPGRSQIKKDRKSGDSPEHGDVEADERREENIPWWKFWARKNKSEEAVPDKKSAPDEEMAPAIAPVKTDEEDVPSAVAAVHNENADKVQADEPRKENVPPWMFWARKKKSDEGVSDKDVAPDEEVAPDDVMVPIKSDDEYDPSTVAAVQSENADKVQPDEPMEDTAVTEEPVKRKSWFSRKKKSEEAVLDKEVAPDEEVTPDVAPAIALVKVSDEEVPASVAAFQSENEEKSEPNEQMKEKSVPLKRFWSRKRTSDEGLKDNDASGVEDAPFTPPVVLEAAGPEESGMEIEFEGEFGTSQRV